MGGERAGGSLGEAGAVAVTAAPDQAPPVGGERILLVDDTTALRRVTSRRLTSLGYSVEEAEDGRTALARFRTLEFRGQFQVNSRWGEGVYENAYAKADGRWLFKRLHLYRTFLAEYAGGWAGAPLPLAGPDPALPPGRPPTVAYESYPGVFAPPFHRGMR